MRKLSTGQPSTLKSYRQLTTMVFGAESPAVKFLDKKIAESPFGEDEEVIADEDQMILVLASIDAGETLEAI